MGHHADSVGSLRLKGLDNGRLYREIARNYDLFFTKDQAFASRVQRLDEPMPVQVVLTLIRQQPEVHFIASFKRFPGQDFELGRALCDLLGPPKKGVLA
jgi:hypothetical protein